MVSPGGMSRSHPQSVRCTSISVRNGIYGLRVARPRLIERRTSQFLREPPTVRNAAGVIVVVTAVVVLASGIAMRVVDAEEYPNVWRGFWWAMQTVTTVGYGDVTPSHTGGRIVAVAVMLWGIAFLAVIVAAITSTFVARAAGERARPGGEGQGSLDGRLDDLAERLERVERALTRLADG